MSLQKLVEGDCGGVNPLIQLGNKFTQDAARADEGFINSQTHFRTANGELVNEFLGQMAGPPQTFQMHTLLQEMREIELGNVPQIATNEQLSAHNWSREFVNSNHKVAATPRTQSQMIAVHEFFDNPPAVPLLQSTNFAAMPAIRNLAICAPYAQQQQQQMITTGTDAEAAATAEDFFKENDAQMTEAIGTTTTTPMTQDVEDWINDFQTTKEENEQTRSDYNEHFWQRLQDEWQKLSEEPDHPWLSDTVEEYEPYQSYEFAEENPMSELEENAFEKGKEYLAKGDIPSAVLCFEVAAKKEPDNAEIWEHLGLAQAENEMDPQSIAALKTSLSLRPDHPNVLMALAISYTNESLQTNALQMLFKWLQVHPKYKHLVEKNSNVMNETANVLNAFSPLRSKRLHDLQNLYLDAVRLNPAEIDPDVQEALGVLYNLSSDYDKAVDCFQAALHVKPNSAKVWNRLGASLANGSRSIEAVEAYQHALALQPGFVRARYNVGVCCMNLKAYKEAAEHFLTALNMQSNFAALKEMPASVNTLTYGQYRMSESIWSTLKMILSLMGRSDLKDYANERNLTALNEAFKD